MQGFLQYEVNKLKLLEVGVSALDGSRREKFAMKATLVGVVLDYPAVLDCGGVRGGSGCGYFGCKCCLTRGSYNKSQHKVMWKLFDGECRRRNQEQVTAHLKKAQLKNRSQYKGCEFKSVLSQLKDFDIIRYYTNYAPLLPVVIFCRLQFRSCILHIHVTNCTFQCKLTFSILMMTVV